MIRHRCRIWQVEDPNYRLVRAAPRWLSFCPLVSFMFGRRSFVGASKWRECCQEACDHFIEHGHVWTSLSLFYMLTLRHDMCWHMAGATLECSMSIKQCLNRHMMHAAKPVIEQVKPSQPHWQNATVAESARS